MICSRPVEFALVSIALIHPMYNKGKRTKDENRRFISTMDIYFDLYFKNYNGISMKMSQNLFLWPYTSSNFIFIGTFLLWKSLISIKKFIQLDCFLTWKEKIRTLLITKKRCKNWFDHISIIWLEKKGRILEFIFSIIRTFIFRKKSFY